jgi:hypothetical protein
LKLATVKISKTKEGERSARSVGGRAGSGRTNGKEMGD